jgi:hypothetical protein
MLNRHILLMLEGKGMEARTALSLGIIFSILFAR